MLRIFLSFSFRPEDRELVGSVENLLESHGVVLVTGENLGGGPLTQEVMRRIEGSDALVAIMTPRERKESGLFTTSQWIRDELSYARAHGKPTIALIHEGVDHEGAYSEHEFIKYDPNQPLPAFLKLSATVGLWKTEAGRIVKVRIEPTQLARRLGPLQPSRCRYRFFHQGTPKEWQDATPVREIGGVFMYLRGMRDDSMFEIEIESRGENWTMPATPEWVAARFRRETEEDGT